MKIRQYIYGAVSFLSLLGVILCVGSMEADNMGLLPGTVISLVLTLCFYVFAKLAEGEEKKS